MEPLDRWLSVPALSIIYAGDRGDTCLAWVLLHHGLGLRAQQRHQSGMAQKYKPMGRMDHRG